MSLPKIYCISLRGEEEYLARFAKSLSNAGFTVVNGTIADWYVRYEDEAKNNPAIVFGTTNIIYDLAKTHPATVPWFYRRLYEPQTYAKVFAPAMAAGLWRIIKFKDLKALEFKEPFFIKPNSGKKLFTGHVVESQQDLYELMQLDLRRDTRLALFEAVKLGKEIRALIYDGSVITASYYKNERGELWTAPVSQQTIAKINNILKDLVLSFDAIAEILADKFLVIDFDELADDIEHSIIEVNSIHSSGFYDCDTDAIAGLMKSYLE